MQAEAPATGVLTSHSIVCICTLAQQVGFLPCGHVDSRTHAVNSLKAVCMGACLFALTVQYTAPDVMHLHSYWPTNNEVHCPTAFDALVSLVTRKCGSKRRVQAGSPDTVGRRSHIWQHKSGSWFVPPVSMHSVLAYAN